MINVSTVLVRHCWNHEGHEGLEEHENHKRIS